ncbi:MAG TPA: hypothetical protein VF723_10950 [Pyrinomonadaceae bacterium]|jgi:hypothetical protein
MISILSARISVSYLIATLVFPALCGRANGLEAQSNSSEQSRHLIICVDGVGFSLIEKMRAGGRFRLFRQPAKMISPFPTLTNVSMTEILKPAGALAETPGYEESYFDAEDNRLRGSLLDRFRSGRFIKGTFRELFDYHPSAIKSGLGYAAPPVTTYLESLTDVIRLHQKFNASREPVFFAYTGASDSLAHLGGERMLRSLLARLDDVVNDIVRDSGGRVRVTIFSDHGNHFRSYKRVPLKEALARAGMRLEGRIRDERSVVLPQFGLVGCAVLFTREANEARVAETVAGVRGVDFAVYESAGVVRIVSRGGRATIERRGQSYRYRAETGDPLGVSAALDRLRAQGKTGEDGFIADADWLAATVAGERPDAVRRVYEGAINHVRNRANVIVSLEDGYYYGSYMLDVFAFLQATHGNLGREQSLGFVMQTGAELPPYVRAENLWETVGSPVLSRAAHAEAEKPNAPAGK